MRLSLLIDEGQLAEIIPECGGCKRVDHMLGSGLVESFPAGSATDEVDAEFLGGFKVPDSIANVDGIPDIAVGLLDCGGDDIGAMVMLGSGDQRDVFDGDACGFEFQGDGRAPVSRGDGEGNVASANFLHDCNGTFGGGKATGVGFIDGL